MTFEQTLDAFKGVRVLELGHEQVAAALKQEGVEVLGEQPAWLEGGES